MRKFKNACCFATSMIGVVVLIAWANGWRLLTAISDNWITMMPATALCFIAAGITTYLMRSNGVGEKSQVLGSALTFGILSVMGGFVITEATGVSFGIERFMLDDPRRVMVVAPPWMPGYPALTTMLAFILIGAAGVAWIFNHRRWIRWLYAGVLGIGSMAMIGYLGGVPALYYDFPGKTNPMAFPTAALFTLLGLCGVDRITLKGVKT